MTRLLSQSPLDEREATAGALRLTEADLGSLNWIAPYPGSLAGVAAALESAFGFGFPAPGTALESDGVRILWSGRDQALLIGPDDIATDLSGVASVINVSDGWAAIQLAGEGAEQVLARLCPIDLRPAEFGSGRTARTLLGHMNAQITPRRDGYEILVMRSMAETAFHEIEEAMRSVAARNDVRLSV